MVRFNSGAGCRDAKSSKKSKISNSFRQSIYQPASHIASHSILTSWYALFFLCRLCDHNLLLYIIIVFFDVF